MKKFYFIIAAIIVIILGLGAILIVNWVKPIPDDAVANAQFSAIIAVSYTHLDVYKRQ